MLPFLSRALFLCLLLANANFVRAQSTVGTGSGSGTFTIGVSAGNFGPPLYLAASRSTANPGTITPIFTSRAPTGTVNTVFPQTVNLASGDTFGGGNCVPGQQILIIAISFTISTCDSATQLHITGSVNNASASLYVLPAHCIGNCQNSVAEDLTIPGHIAGTEKITRVTDGASTCPNLGASPGMTASQGDNDVMFSKSATYLAIHTGTNCIYHLTTLGGAAQVVNTGSPKIIVAGAGFAFSRAVDTRFYTIQPAVGTIQRNDITSDTTSTQTTVATLLGAGTCPGVPVGFTANWVSILSVSLSDTRIALALGPAGQGSAYLGFVWDQSLGCEVVNFRTGQVYPFCNTGSCAAVAPIGTFSAAGNTCWGTSTNTNGFHDAMMLLDGNYMIFEVTGAWTQGACAGIATGGPAVWQIGTTGNQWCANTGAGNAQCGAHLSPGASHIVGPSQTGNYIRSEANVLSFSQFTQLMPVTDFHGTWANPLGADSYPWCGASDLVTAAQGGVYAPQYLSNTIFCSYPSVLYPPGQIRVFAHTYSCGQAPRAACTGGQDASFNSQESIGNMSQDGNWFAFNSSILCSLGLDSAGKCRSDVFVLHAQ